MPEIQRAIALAVGLLILLLVGVSLVVRHQIGGFFRNVAREERETQEREAEEEARKARADGDSPDNTTHRGAL